MARVVYVAVLLSVIASADHVYGQMPVPIVRDSVAQPVLEPILWATLGSLTGIGASLIASGEDFEISGWPSPLSEGALPLVEFGAVTGTALGSYVGSRARAQASPGVESIVLSAVALYGLSLALPHAENAVGSAPAVILLSLGQGSASVLGPAAWNWIQSQF